MLRPDSVRRVTPPTTITAKTRVEENISQLPTDRGGRSSGFVEKGRNPDGLAASCCGIVRARHAGCRRMVVPNGCWNRMLVHGVLNAGCKRMLVLSAVLNAPKSMRSSCPNIATNAGITHPFSPCFQTQCYRPVFVHALLVVDRCTRDNNRRRTGHPAEADQEIFPLSAQGARRIRCVLALSRNMLLMEYRWMWYFLCNRDCKRCIQRLANREAA